MDEETTSSAHSLTVDRVLCESAAICLAYQIYELDDEAKAVILTKNGGNSDEPKNPLAPGGWVTVEDLANPTSITHKEMQALVLESARACPFNAIIVKDKVGNQIWPPIE